MSVIYLIEKIDFGVESITKDQDISIEPIGYVEEESTALRICEELEKKSKEQGYSYEVEGEVGSYPRFTFTKLKKMD